MLSAQTWKARNGVWQIDHIGDNFGNSAINALHMLT